MRAARWALCAASAIAVELGAQTVLLELRPQDGDTLRMRLDQTTETVAQRRGAAPMNVSTTLRMFSRAIVEERSPASTIILAITDSIDLSSSDPAGKKVIEAAQRQLTGRQMRLRLAPNGTVALVDAGQNVPREVNDLVSVMPASFPSEPVSIGDSWSREMPIPAGVRLGIPLGGVVRSTFRLDSVGKDGRLAYVSMRGSMHPIVVGAADDASIGGSIDGSMIVDRRRGWLSESRFRIQMRTTVESRGGRLIDPMQFRTTITQRMRVEKP